MFKEDILQQIKLDFNDSTGKAVKILNNSISKPDYLNTDRIIRSIIFLASRDIDKLKKYIDNASFEERCDIMGIV